MMQNLFSKFATSGFNRQQGLLVPGKRPKGSHLLNKRHL
jgi:hypothetical protein